MLKKVNRKTMIIIGVLVAFILTATLMMFSDKIHIPGSSDTPSGSSEMIEANAVSDEITKGTIVSQTFKCNEDSVKKVALVFTKLYSLENTYITIELLDGNTTLIKQDINVQDIPDQHRVYAQGNTVSGLKGKELTLKIYPASDSDTGVALMINDGVNSSFNFGSKKMTGSICFSVSGD